MASNDSSLWGFLRTRKKYWLLPIAIVFVVFALLVIASIGSEGNFVYTLN
jgi:hypothetical protein